LSQASAIATEVFMNNAGSNGQADYSIPDNEEVLGGRYGIASEELMGC
jgi:hypothetical protein